MDLRAGDRLLLDDKARADLDFAAHAERVDALIAERLRGARSDDLPMIVTRAVIDRLHGLSVPRKTEQIELAVAIHVRRVEDLCRTHGMVEQREFVLFIAEPHQRACRIRPWRHLCQIQIDGPVVVEIGGAHAHVCRKPIGGGRHARDFRRDDGLILAHAR